MWPSTRRNSGRATVELAGGAARLAEACERGGVTQFAEMTVGELEARSLRGENGVLWIRI
jgi:hypothetical protein